MKSTLLNQHDGLRTFALILATGDEAAGALLLSLVGDVTLDDEKPSVHAHVVLGKSNASTLGGYLIEAHVRPTLEIIIVEEPRHLRRRFDPVSGLALIEPEILAASSPPKR